MKALPYLHHLTATVYSHFSVLEGVVHRYWLAAHLIFCCSSLRLVNSIFHVHGDVFLPQNYLLSDQNNLPYQPCYPPQIQSTAKTTAVSASMKALRHDKMYNSVGKQMANLLRKEINFLSLPLLFGHLRFRINKPDINRYTIFFIYSI